jgi:hypothetical protein
MKPESNSKKNCWEFMSCGRQSGGARAHDLGVCPVSTTQALDGAHDGQNAGRACWVVAKSLCGGKIQGSYDQKLIDCWRCDFFKTVKKEEEPNVYGFSTTRLGIEKLIERKRRNP